MNQAEIDALRREHSAPSPVLSVAQDLRSTMTPPGTPSLPPLALDTGDKRPTSPFMAPLNLDGVASPLKRDAGGDEKTPTSAATARTDGSVDEPCTYEVEGIGGRIPRGVSVDLSQMGMEEWDDPAATGSPGDVVRERAALDNPGGQPLNGEPVDTWNLVLDNPPSGMMMALDECVDGVDAVNEMGYTCVMWAALYGKEEHLIVLLECEADVTMQLQEDYYSKTYPAGSTALDIATITQEKTGSDRKLIIQMLSAASEAKWDEWKASEKGAKVWRKWQEKWEKDKQKREREERSKREREKKRKAMERRAVQRVRENPFAASTQTVSTWLNSLGHDLGQYAAVFDTQAVDGATLMSLTEKHLKEELKVRTLGQRLRILRARDESLGIATKVSFATKEEVGLWMTQIGLSMYAYAFESNEIDGNALCALSEEQLRDDLHVRTLGHRLKVLNLREDFREQCGGERQEQGQGGGTGGTRAGDDEEAAELRRRARRRASGATGGGGGGSSDRSTNGRDRRNSGSSGGGGGGGGVSGGGEGGGGSSSASSLRRGASAPQPASSSRAGGGGGGGKSGGRSKGSKSGGGGGSASKGNRGDRDRDRDKHHRDGQQEQAGGSGGDGTAGGGGGGGGGPAPSRRGRWFLGMGMGTQSGGGGFRAGFVAGGLISVVLTLAINHAINRMIEVMSSGGGGGGMGGAVPDE